MKTESKRPAPNYELGGIPNNAKGQRFIRDLRLYANRGRYILSVRPNGPRPPHSANTVMSKAVGFRVYFRPGEAVRKEREERKAWEGRYHSAIIGNFRATNQALRDDVEKLRSRLEEQIEQAQGFAAEVQKLEAEARHHRSNFSDVADSAAHWRQTFEAECSAHVATARRVVRMGWLCLVLWLAGAGVGAAIALHFG